MSDIDGMNLKIDTINTPEKLRRLEEFAKSFDHEVGYSNHPLMAFRFGDRPWHSYAQIYQGPLVFTAWHTDPKVCSKRDVRNTAQHINGYLKINFGGGLAAVPIKCPTFTQEVMESLGYIRCNQELYKTLA